ncbi:MAG: Uma2 family endonuclease [Pseudomonadota bacterium]
MADTAFKRATYDDLLALPENMVGEIINGVLYSQPRPAPKHAIAASAMGAKIGGPFSFNGDGPGGWVILDEPELHLDDEVLVPDLAGWRRERFEVPETAYFEIVPDWVCEILSPSTISHDRVRKMTQYADFKVQYAWLIDPIAKTLEAYRNESGQWLQIATLGEKGEVAVEPFEAAPFLLESLWL